MTRHRDCLRDTCIDSLHEEKQCGNLFACIEEQSTCPNGTVYSSCGKPCMHRCSESASCLSEANNFCKAGCFCPESFIFDDTLMKCVSPSECRCKSEHSGKVLQAGESEMDDCNRCRCSSGRIVCTNYDCTKMKRGNWCPWSSWTPCSMTCGSQSRSRIQKCGCPKPSGGSVVGCDDFTEQIGTELVKTRVRILRSLVISDGS